MDARLYKRLQENPIIAAIRDETGLERCLKAEPSVVFVLYGDICGIGGIVERIKKVRNLTGLPVLAGGLITEKQEVLQALAAGALAISSTAGAVWDM